MYKVTFYTLPSGKSPIKEFILSSHESMRSKIARQIKYLKEFGLTLANPSLKKLIGTKLWEARILGKDSARIICMAMVGNEIVIVHIFKKKGNKMPKKDLNIALKRYEYLTTDI